MFRPANVLPVEEFEFYATEMSLRGLPISPHQVVFYCPVKRMPNRVKQISSWLLKLLNLICRDITLLTLLSHHYNIITTTKKGCIHTWGSKRTFDSGRDPVMPRHRRDSCSCGLAPPLPPEKWRTHLIKFFSLIFMEEMRDNITDNLSIFSRNLHSSFTFSFEMVPVLFKYMLEWSFFVKVVSWVLSWTFECWLGY